MMRWLCLLCFWAICGQGLAQDRCYFQYTMEDGLPSSTVYGITQDHDGFIWLGTSRGLVRFDGRQFRVWGIEQGLEKEDVWGVKRTESGRIWILSFAKRMQYLYRDSIYPVELSLPVHQLPTTFERTEGDTTYLNLAHLHQPQYRIAPDGQWNFNLSSQEHVRFLGFDQPSGNRFSLIEVSENEKQLLIEGPDSQATFECPSVAIGNLGAAWIFSKEELIIIRSSEGLHSFNYRTHRWSFAAYHDLLQLSQPDLGNLGVSASENYLMLRNEGSCTLFTPDFERVPLLNGMNHLGIISHFEDREGNLWLGSRNQGLILIPKYSLDIQKVQFSRGPSEASITAMATLPNQQLWLALTDESLVCWPDTQLRIHLNEVIESSSHPGNLSILEFKRFKNTLWLRTNRYVLLAKDVHLPPDQWQWTLFEGFFDRFRYPKCLLPEEDGTCWVGTSAGLYRLAANASFEKIMPHRCTSLAKDQQGVVWAGTSDGLFSWQEDSLQFLGHAFPELGLSIQHLSVHESGRLFISIPGKGIYQLAGEHLLAVPATKALKVNAMEVGDDLWIATASGAWQWSLSDQHLCPLPPLARGLGAEMYRVQAEANRLVLANRNSIFLLPSNGIPTTSETQLSLQGIRSGHRKWDARKKPSEFPRNSLLEFQFSQLAFPAPVQPEGYYRLLPNKSWQPLSLTELQFINLAPGEYEFQATAMASDTLGPTPQLKYRFSIPKHWTQAFWVQWGLPLAVGLMGFLWYRIRLRKVGKRINEKARLKEEIARLEVKALSAQMHPHFIFNCLNSLQFLVMDDKKELAYHYLANFGKLIRLNLAASGERWASLAQELTRLELYAGLEKMRLNDNLKLSLAVQPDIDPEKVRVPIMLLQPLVENAIVHGFQRSVPQANEILISIQKEGPHLKIEVVDNGIGLQQAKANRPASEHPSLGLSMVKKRLALEEESEHPTSAFQIEDRSSTDEGLPGTRVTLQMPFRLIATPQEAAFPIE
ncbi:MAG: histidine kinase [Salibacteraceae bacterium]